MAQTVAMLIQINAYISMEFLDLPPMCCSLCRSEVRLDQANVEEVTATYHNPGRYHILKGLIVYRQIVNNKFFIVECPNCVQEDEPATTISAKGKSKGKSKGQ